MSLSMHMDRGRFGRGLLALLLAGALLLCHGGILASHACADSLGSSASLHASGNHSLAEAGAGDHEQASWSLRVAADHFAVLLIIFLGLLLGLLFGGVRLWGITTEPRPCEHHLRTYALRSVRETELALIQVFRL